MKTWKHCQVIAIAAIIALALAFTACNKGGGGGTRDARNYAGTANEAPDSLTPSDGGGGDGIWPGSWPPANVRADFSISGLDQPPDTWVSHYSIEYGGSVLSITFTATNYDATQTYLNNWFTSNGWVVDRTTTPGSVIWKIQNIYPMARFIYSDKLAVLDVVMN